MNSLFKANIPYRYANTLSATTAYSLQSYESLVGFAIVIEIMAARSASRGWIKGGWVTSGVKLTDKNVLITGGNIGLGYETALDLAKRDARVIIACRDMSKADAAKTKVKDFLWE